MYKRQQFLILEKLLTNELIEDIKAQIKADINSALDTAFAEEEIKSSTDQELADMYSPFDFEEQPPANSTTTNIRMVDAISDGLKQSMQKYPNTVVMGQDIAEYGGVFKITDGFIDEFGKERVRNTPICESAIVSAAMGLSINGYKAIVEMQFADFVSSGFNPIVNYLAKVHYRWGQAADVVVRMPTGAGVGAGPFHSQSNEAWFTHTPGLKVVYPAFPADAKGLLAAAIEDPNPVMFFEHKALYRSVYQEVNDDYYTLEIGKANIVKEGKDVTLVSFGKFMKIANEAAAEMQKEGVHVEVIDLRSVKPIDYETIIYSVKKTNRLVLLEETWPVASISSEISHVVQRNAFDYLDAPIYRVVSKDLPLPYAPSLIEEILPNVKKTIGAINAVMYR